MMMINLNSHPIHFEHQHMKNMNVAVCIFADGLGMLMGFNMV
jgi:hypothetical protein